MVYCLIDRYGGWWSGGGGGGGGGGNFTLNEFDNDASSISLSPYPQDM